MHVGFESGYYIFWVFEYKDMKTLDTKFWNWLC